MGFDYEMTFTKLCYICFHVQNGIKLFGTNPDKWTSAGKYRAPNNGSLIDVIEVACLVKAEIIGKPNTYVIERIIKSNNLKREECIMIGDNRETDIAFGNSAGIATLCVLTGASTEDEIISSQSLGGIGMPMYYSNNLFE